MAATNHIQQRLNDDIADIPLFHGDKNINTIKPATYVDRIEQGIASLAWMQAQYFTYFHNSVRGRADNWFKNYLFDFPNAELTRAKFKPLLCQHFDASCLQNTFIPQISKISLAEHKDDLEAYYRAINDIISAEKECYITAMLEFPDDLGLTADQKLFVKQTFQKGCSNIYENLKCECFINGLSPADFNRLKNKANMTTAKEMYEFLLKDTQF